MTPTITGTSSSRSRSPKSSPRIAFSLRTSGARSACSRAAGRCTTRSTGRSRTSCCSAARLTTSSGRMRLPRRQGRCCPSEPSMVDGGARGVGMFKTLAPFHL